MTDRQLSITSMTTSVVMFIGMMFIHFNPLGIQKLKPKVAAGTIEITNVNGLQAALDARANANHNHEIDNVNGLPAALDAKAAANHNHEIDNVNGLQDALDNKEDKT